MKRTEQPGQKKIGPPRESRSVRYFMSRVLGIFLLPIVIFILGMLPFFSLFFVFFLLLIFLIKPSEEIRKAPLRIVLWTILVLPVLLAGFGAPFRSLTIIMAGFLERVPWSNDMRQFFEPMPLGAAVGVIGALLAAICGSFSIITLRMQRQQLVNIPTATAGSAAIGLAELKGRARIAKDAYHKMQVESFHPGEPDIPEGIPRERVLQAEERWTGNAIGHRKMWRTFYLEDGTGRVLVDPRGIEFWDGQGSPYFKPLRKIHLADRVDRRFVNPLPEETRWLEDGDPVYVIGSVEMNPGAPSGAVDAERLIIRPSSELRQPGLLERLVLPGFIAKKLVPGRRYHHLFYLSDRSEQDLATVTKKAELRVLLWAMVWMGLSLTLAVRALSH